MYKNRDKFIVIEGTDGSGKGTQAKILEKRLKEFGREVVLFDFPQYFKPSSYFAKAYLQGVYGSISEVSPRKASVFYAVDRFEAGKKIRQALESGKTVLANRYVASNMGHQGAKLRTAIERKKYFKWNEEFEYKILEIPRPDINIILHVPASVAQKLVDQKTGAERFYTKGKKRDLHEEDLNHLKQAEKTYLEIAHLWPKQFTLIKCAPKGKLLDIQTVAEKIWKEVFRQLKN